MKQPLRATLRCSGKFGPRLNSLRFTPLRQTPLFPQISPPLLACFNGDSTTKDKHHEPTLWAGSLVLDYELNGSIGIKINENKWGQRPFFLMNG
jgi:hypothetical protein